MIRDQEIFEVGKLNDLISEIIFDDFDLDVL